MVDSETIKNAGFSIDIDLVKKFEVREDDIFLITYPKSGTTWMKEIVPLVLNGGDVAAVNALPPDVRAPYLEFVLSAEDPILKELLTNFGVPGGFDIDTQQSPRVIVSHLRDDFLPTQFAEKRPKVIYVARNPKDVAVSTFHFVQKELPAINKKAYDGFSDFLPDFMNARNGIHTVVYDGSTWPSHVLTWWKRRHEPNVCFVTFEDMKKDLPGNIRIISEFLGVKLSDDVIQRIAEHCSFDKMKQNPVSLKSDYCVNVLKVDPSLESPFVRKGQVGGWKSVFSEADNETFDKMYREWMKDSDFEPQFEL
ncbi:sulfotransferase 1E1-like [Ptychodera flava]|uniref:sulfotransferase 1E1-like n=1 Tax=Ptychodera flava TaxID=63121 RepID=UPI003969BF55